MLGRSLRESWRFVRLFGVGLAWGAPLALLAFVNTAPGVAAHPELARLVAPIQWELLVASPFVAVAGVVIVGKLSQAPPRLSKASAIPLAAFVAVPVCCGVAGEIVTSPLVTLLGLVVVASAGAAGLVVTVVTLWKHWRWSGIAWPLVWLLGTAMVVTSSSQTSQAGEDLGGGLVAGLALGGVVLAAFITAAVVFFVTGLQARPVPGIDAPSAATTETFTGQAQ